MPNHVPPWLKHREGPKGLHGWLRINGRGPELPPPPHLAVTPPEPPEVIARISTPDETPSMPWHWDGVPVPLVLQGVRAGFSDAQVAADTDLSIDAVRLIRKFDRGA